MVSLVDLPQNILNEYPKQVWTFSAIPLPPPMIGAESYLSGKELTNLLSSSPPKTEHRPWEWNSKVKEKATFLSLLAWRFPFGQ